MNTNTHSTEPQWIDISVPVYTGMAHWPDNPPITLERIMSFDKGNQVNVSGLSLGVHTGTHMDAPAHFFKDGNGIETLPFDATIGLARVVEITDTESIKPQELQTKQIQAGERLLFKTVNSVRCWHTDEFIKDFVYISRQAAQYLVDRQVQTVGVDYLSVGGYFKDGAETHHALLGAKIGIIEGLNLSQLQEGYYELICLPIKLRGSDGAPARAIVRPVQGNRQ